MKTLSILVLLTVIMFPTLGQVVSNVNWELEGDERIVITYDLAKKDSYIYFDVSVKVKIENQTITPKALSGDVGNFIKVGTGKKIIWNMFEDISELNGELSVEVLAVNPVPSGPVSNVQKSDTTSVSTATLPSGGKIPFWVGMSGIGATGVGLLMSGLKSSSESQDLYNIYKVNTDESSAVYDEMGSTRDDVYDEANKKHKTGTLMTVAGGAVLLTAGIIMVNRMIQAKKLRQQNLSFSPLIKINPGSTYGSIHATTGLTITYRLR